MTNHLAAIREAAEQLNEAVHNPENYAPDTFKRIMKETAIEILRILDAAEKDSTCRVVDTDYQYDECSKCKSALYPGDFCPGCGRRIVKEEKD